jgi:hypothetical protein
MMDIKRNSGQSYTEYVIVVMMVAMALLAKDETGQPYINKLIVAIKQHYLGYATSIALPEMPSNK